MSTHVTIAKKPSGHNLRVSILNPGANAPTEHVLADNQVVEVLVYGNGQIRMAEVEKQKEPVKLPDVEAVSSAVHEAWMSGKLASGVTSRLAEDGEELMVPYADLSEKAKELDRASVRAVFAAIAKAA
jgi:hypothetical protein